jgi:uncharacterized membrane protein YdjX (TVP38/TMEM64 family)
VSAITFYVFVLGGNVIAIAEQAKQFGEQNLILAGVAYVLLLSVRGMIFIPSTPLLLAGLAVFPSHFTYVTNMVGILASCCLVMVSVNRVGIDAALANVNNKHYQKLSKRIRSHGFSAIILWSFFPFAPTDAIVYVASGVGVSKKKIITGVMIGEAILMFIYVYGGKVLLERLLA